LCVDPAVRPVVTSVRTNTGASHAAIPGLLRGVMGESAGSARAAERLYLTLWREAPRFDPAGGSAYPVLLRAARRELVGRGARHDHAESSRRRAIELRTIVR
jgi:hypothetical protein